MKITKRRDEQSTYLFDELKVGTLYRHTEDEDDLYLVIRGDEDVQPGLLEIVTGTAYYSGDSEWLDVAEFAEVEAELIIGE